MQRAINLAILNKEKNWNVWNFYWYDSTDDEDNDSSDGSY